MQQNKKCGTCKFFWVSADKAELAEKAPHISQCQPGLPHCLGGQVRGACQKWQERADMGLPMPWTDGPMVESTFSCMLWRPGGPSIKRMGSYNTKKEEEMPGWVKSIGFGISLLALGTVVMKSGGVNKPKYMKIVRSPDDIVYTTIADFVEDNDDDIVAEYIDIIYRSTVGDIIPVNEMGNTQMIIVSEEEYKEN